VILQLVFDRYLPSGEKIVKIGQVDTEIALLILKKIKNEEEITEGKIYPGRQVCQAG